MHARIVYMVGLYNADKRLAEKSFVRITL